MSTAWIVLGLVFILVVIDWMIGRLTIKRCEAEMVRTLKYVEKLRNDTIKNLNDVLKEKLKEQNDGVVNLVKAILDQANAKIKIANDNIKIANGIIQKPAELKLTVNFKGQK